MMEMVMMMMMGMLTTRYRGYWSRRSRKLFLLRLTSAEDLCFRSLSLDRNPGNKPLPIPWDSGVIVPEERLLWGMCEEMGPPVGIAEGVLPVPLAHGAAQLCSSKQYELGATCWCGGSVHSSVTGLMSETVQCERVPR